jgi:O-methyltransferase
MHMNTPPDFQESAAMPLFRKIQFVNRNQVVSQFLFGLAQTPALAALARYPTRHGPPWLRQVIERQKRKHRRLGFAMVPQKALRATLRKGLNRLMHEVGRDRLGDYLEFGVHSCTSLLCMYWEATALGLVNMRLFGFDSFEGLPVSDQADDIGTWRPGAFQSDYEFALRILEDEHVDRSRVLLTPGWFSDTLTPDFVRRNSLSKVSVVMIDCDQYLGASQALKFCAPLIQDQAVLLFDDWNSEGLAARNLGEKRAFDEFMSTGEFTAEPMESYTSNAAVFLVSRRST